MVPPEPTIHRILAPVFAAIAAILMTLVAPSPAGALSLDGCSGGGIPLEILDASDESGIGGTGLESDPSQGRRTDLAGGHRSNPLSHEDGAESGIGGTGRSPGSSDDESGIGGTGIFGPITARHLDRVCVNGLEISIPERLSSQTANATASGDSSTGEAIAVGTVVWIEATPTAEGLIAERIDIAPTLAGRISKIDANGRRLIVAGQPVRLPDPIRGGPIPGPQELRPGDAVTVHGLRDPSGEWIASRIESGSPEHGIRSPSNGDDRPEAPPEVISRWLAKRPGPRFLSIEGYIEARRDDRDAPSLAGLPLAFGSGMTGDSRERLRPGARVRATGRLTPEGNLRIERLPESFRAHRPETLAPHPSSSRNGETPPSKPSDERPSHPRPPRPDDPDRSWQDMPRRPERPPHRIRRDRRPPRPPIGRRRP